MGYGWVLKGYGTQPSKDNSTICCPLLISIDVKIQDDELLLTGGFLRIHNLPYL